VTTDGVHPGAEAELASYGRTLSAAAMALRDDPYDRLAATLRQAREALSCAGPRLARDAMWLAQREEYLADAASAIGDGVARLGVAFAAPAESDVGVRVTRLRENVRYFADVVSDVVPAPVYLDVGRDLLPMIEETYGAPGLTLQLLPLAEAVLGWMGAACGLAVTLAARADAVLAQAVPGGAPGLPPHQLLYDVHRAEIDRLILALGRSRPVLLARPREDDDTYARAVAQGLSLTPRQLYSALARYGGPGRAGSDPVPLV
jgi:hypothetical protein